MSEDVAAKSLEAVYVSFCWLRWSLVSKLVLAKNPPFHVTLILPENALLSMKQISFGSFDIIIETKTGPCCSGSTLNIFRFLTFDSILSSFSLRVNLENSWSICVEIRSCVLALRSVARESLKPFYNYLLSRLRLRYIQY